MRNKKRYIVSYDNQGGEFGMFRLYTIDEWREQAIEWADADENDGIIKELKKLPKKDIMDYIAEFWDLQFEQVDINKWTWDYQTNELVLYNENDNKLRELFVIRHFTEQDYKKLPKQDTQCLDAIIERLNNDWWGSGFGELSEIVKTTIYDYKGE